MLKSSTFIILYLLICISGNIEIQAQCNPPDQLPAVLCENAPLICLQDACFETTDQQEFGWNGFCGSNTAIHNPQYFEIIPTEECIQINIHVDNCNGGSQLQAALVTSCNWLPCPGNSPPCPDILDCDPGTPVGGTMFIESCGLVPGESVWLLIDGSSGAQCQYTIDFVEGIYEPPIVEEIQSGEAIPQIVCQGYEDLVLQVGPSITNAHGYMWEMSWNGQNVTSTLPELHLDIPQNAPVGIWEVCVSAFSGCDTTDIPFCFEVEIYDPIDVIKESTLCPEAFPFDWFDISIPGPGTYMQTFEPEGCVIDTTWVIEEFPEIPVGMLDVQHCYMRKFIPFVYEGQSYDQSGMYTINFDGEGLNGCDSLLILNLTISGTEYFIENSCEHGESVLIPQITSQTNIDTVTYEWYDCNLSTLLSSNKILEIDSQSCYCLVINNGDCIDTLCNTYGNSPCDYTCDILPQSACVGDSILLSLDLPDSVNADAHWLIELAENNTVYFSGEDSLWLTFDSEGCYRVSQTIVFDTSTVTCIDSICVIPPITEASICCSGVACGDCATLEITLTGTPPWDIVVSDGSQFDTITGIVTSPYRYEVCNEINTVSEYSIVEVLNISESCPAMITGTPAEVIFFYPLLPSDWSFATQYDTLLCAPEGLLGYSWHTCDDTTVIGTSQCLTIENSGCYCIDGWFVDTCVFSFCEQVIVSVNDENSYNRIAITPNPSNGKINIHITDQLALPVNWKLIDHQGRKINSGTITKLETELNFSEEVASGLYFIVLENVDYRVVRKVVFTK